MQPVVSRHPYGEHARQYFLLAEPSNCTPGDQRPWAVYLHGGAWTFGTPEAFLPAAQPWLEAGFRVVLPSYRRPPRVGISGIVADCRAALAGVSTLARATQRPLGRVQVGGISAGGHLAALLALHPEWWAEAGWPCCPEKALLLAAPLDLQLLRPRFLFDRYSDSSPCGGPGPTDRTDWLLLHGDRDGFVDYEHSRRFAQRLQAAGAAVRLVTIPGGGHLDAGRWTYDARNPYRGLIEEFIRRGGPAPPAPG